LCVNCRSKTLVQSRYASLAHATQLPSRDTNGPSAPRWVENSLNDINVVRLIINLPPRHLKSLLASVAFPAWCLGHDPSAQFLSVSYAQDPPTSSPAIAAPS